MEALLWSLALPTFNTGVAFQQGYREMRSQVTSLARMGAPVNTPNIFVSSIFSVDPQSGIWKSILVNTDANQLIARREWLELSRKQIAEYAGIPVCAVDLLEVGNEVSEDVASAYERSLKKLEFRKVMQNLP